MATIKIRRGTTDPITLAPAGVTAGEPIFNTALNKLFVHNGTTGIWVGGEVDNSTSLGSSQIKIPTQYAVKTYVDNNLSSGAVTSINGVTGAASLRAGTGISITPGTDPDKGITITNIGVQSLAGTANQITVSGSTGAITLSLPSPMTVPGNMTVTGTLTVNGSTTTVNSTTVTIQDPIFTLGGTAALTSDDNKDRGIEFRWHNGTVAKTGFFGYDDSTGYMTFIPDATNTSEVFSGTPGTMQAYAFRGVSGTNTQLIGTNTAEASVSVLGAAAAANTSATVNAASLALSHPDGSNVAGLRFLEPSNGYYSELKLSGALNVSNINHVLPNWAGYILAPSNNGTANYILKGNGTTSQQTWIDPTQSGFTAYAATTVAATEQTTGIMYLTGVASAGSGLGLLVDAVSQAGLGTLSYNNATATLTAYKVEAIVDGGSY